MNTQFREQHFEPLHRLFLAYEDEQYQNGWRKLKFTEFAEAVACMQQLGWKSRTMHPRPPTRREHARDWLDREAEAKLNANELNKQMKQKQ